MLNYVKVSAEFCEQMGIPAPKGGDPHITLPDRAEAQLTAEEKAYQVMRRSVLDRIHRLHYRAYFSKYANADDGITARVGVSPHGCDTPRWIGEIGDVAAMDSDELATLLASKFEGEEA
jgi:hypothetical protein